VLRIEGNWYAGCLKLPKIAFAPGKEQVTDCNQSCLLLICMHYNPSTDL